MCFLVVEQFFYEARTQMGSEAREGRHDQVVLPDFTAHKAVMQQERQERSGKLPSHIFFWFLSSFLSSVTLKHL
jgi:hypothetical protein